MQSKRDQVQAHVFLMSRLTSSMLLAEPDAPESPLGRTTRGTMIGVIVGVLVAAGALVFGLLKPGGQELSGKNLIINRDTGARFFFVQGELRPVRNYASALLIAGAQMESDDVRTASLRGKPVGAPVGIPGAPDSVPGAKDLQTGAWQVCSVVDDSYATALVTGQPVTGRRLGADEGVLVTDPEMEATYLMWQGRRLRLDEGAGSAASLGYSSQTPRPVSEAFLRALARGPDLSPPNVPGRGETGPELGGRTSKVGQVFQAKVPGSAAKYYLLKRKGLVPLTDTQAALVLGDPATRTEAYGGASPDAIALAAVDLQDYQAPGAEGRDTATGLPTSPPRAVNVRADESACTRVNRAGKSFEVSTDLIPAASLAPAAQADPLDVDKPCIPVDRVITTPGHGSLVQALTAQETAGGVTYLVSESGIKYRLTPQALEALGYADAKVQLLPAPLLSMLPSGPDLDPAVAARGLRGDTTAACPSGE